MLLLTKLRERRVTNSRARDVLGIDSTDARPRLQRLRDAGILVQHGTRGRAYYTLAVLGPGRSNEQVVVVDRVAARQLLRRLVDEDRRVQLGEKRGTTCVLPTRRRKPAR